MNEWQLQELLTKHWIQNPLICRDEPFKLVCWELMFPSWRINSKRSKWNEPSVDFIFYSESWKVFLIFELKNKIVGKKGLLSAYCQVSHRTAQFVKDFSIDKIENSRSECFRNYSAQIGKDVIPEKIHFSKDCSGLRVIMASSFPDYATSYIDTIKYYFRDEINREISNYSQTKEFLRFINLDEQEFMITKSLDIDIMPVSSSIYLEIDD